MRFQTKSSLPDEHQNQNPVHSRACLPSSHLRFFRSGPNNLPAHYSRGAKLQGYHIVLARFNKADPVINISETYFSCFHVIVFFLRGQAPHRILPFRAKKNVKIPGKLRFFVSFLGFLTIFQLLELGKFRLSLNEFV